MIRSTRSCFTALRHVVLQFLAPNRCPPPPSRRRPQPLEAYVAHELFQLGEIGLRFARITDQQRACAAPDRDGSCAGGDQLHRLRLGVAPLHGRELGVGDVLERNVEVLADFGLRGHDLDHLVGECRGVGVVQAYPLDASDAAQPAKQFGQHPSAVEVEP